MRDRKIKAVSDEQRVIVRLLISFCPQFFCQSNGFNWRFAEALAKLVEHFLGPACAAASDAELADFEKSVEISNTASGFHLNVGRCVLPHEGQVLERRTARAVAGAGLDPVGV